MPKSKEKSSPASGIFISDEAIGRTVRRSGAWAVKHFRLSILPALIVGLGAGVGGYAAGSYSPGTHDNLSSSTAAARSSLTISLPSQGDSVPRCTLVSGTATLSPGDSIWILVHARDPQVYYLEGRASTAPTTDPRVVSWRFQATVGSKSSSGQYVIVAAVVDHAMSDYLAGMLDADTLKPNAGGLADASLPPDVTTKYLVSVQRVQSENAECA
jgi:hypothetical protein